MNRSTTIPEFAIAFVIVALLTSSAAYAAATQPQPQSFFYPNKIIGLWDVEVVVADCNTGEPSAAFRAMHQYSIGGTGVIVPATNPTLLSAHLAVWSHVRQNSFRQVFKFFRFDANGMPIGWTVIRNEITLNQGGNEYVGSGVAEFYNAAGDFLFSACPSIIGTRFTGQG